jgi:hypothetical protein
MPSLPCATPSYEVGWQQSTRTKWWRLHPRAAGPRPRISRTRRRRRRSGGRSAAAAGRRWSGGGTPPAPWGPHSPSPAAACRTAAAASADTVWRAAMLKDWRMTRRCGRPAGCLPGLSAWHPAHLTQAQRGVCMWCLWHSLRAHEGSYLDKAATKAQLQVLPAMMQSRHNTFHTPLCSKLQGPTTRQPAGQLAN